MLHAGNTIVNDSLVRVVGWAPETGVGEDAVLSLQCCPRQLQLAHRTPILILVSWQHVKGP